jgi:hypothetical protein
MMADLAELEQLKAFARELLRDAWEGFDGADIVQEAALKHGLILPVEGGFNPAVHRDPNGDAEPGDTWYVFAAFLKTRAQEKTP